MSGKAGGDFRGGAPVEGEDLSRQLLEMAVLEGYKSGLLTAHQIKEILGLGSRIDVDGFLKAHGVPMDYSFEDLERERASLDALLGE